MLRIGLKSQVLLTFGNFVQDGCLFLADAKNHAPTSLLQSMVQRGIVERTFAWFHNYRRLSKDYEELTETVEATIYAAMTHLMVRRLARLKAA